MVEDLLRGFVREDWVGRLDFSTLERVNASYVSGDLKRREGDVLWRAHDRSRGGAGPVYVYLLLEFQSDVQRFMALRVLGYVTLLYQDLVARGELTPSGRLPQVRAVILYNGKERWWAPREVSALIEGATGDEPDLPRLRYRVIDQGGDFLDEPGNLCAALFQLEGSSGPEELRQGVARLLAALQGQEEDGHLLRAFGVWLRRVLLPGRGLEADIPEMLGFQEFRTMLEEAVQKWNRQLKAEGRREGRREMILRQLERKFGPLDAGTRSRVRAASARLLLEWGERFVTAERLSDVFGE